MSDPFHPVNSDPLTPKLPTVLGRAELEQMLSAVVVKPTVYAGGFLFHGSKVALVLKSKPAWQFGLLNCVGGGVEEGETPRQAMQREFKEETQVDTIENDWTEKLVISGEGWRVHFFAATWYELCPLVGTKMEPVSWQPYDPLPRHVIPNLRWIVPFMLDPDVVVPLWVTDRRGADYGKRAAECEANTPKGK